MNEFEKYIITTPEQVTATDFAKELRNTKFKEEVVHFLIDH